jgi:hypothetical protein
MKSAIVLFAVPLLLAGNAAGAATAAGPPALALAALVAERAPSLGLAQKQVIARLFDGDIQGVPSYSGKIAVTADSVVCRASDVDITARSCKLSFGAKTVTLLGRRAHELSATIAEAGVASDGAAGSIYESLTHLSCTPG